MSFLLGIVIQVLHASCILRMLVYFTTVFQVYIIGGDGTQRGASVIFEVNVLINCIKGTVLLDSFDVIMFPPTSCALLLFFKEQIWYITDHRIE